LTKRAAVGCGYLAKRSVPVAKTYAATAVSYTSSAAAAAACAAGNYIKQDVAKVNRPILPFSPHTVFVLRPSVFPHSQQS
jgi:hypothetical protein